MHRLFVSDLHLSDDTPGIEAAFTGLLKQESPFDSLVMLGDFFEAWVGDDDDSPLADRVKLALRALAGSLARHRPLPPVPPLDDEQRVGAQVDRGRVLRALALARHRAQGVCGGTCPESCGVFGSCGARGLFFVISLIRKS